MTFQEADRLLKANDWSLARKKGSHHTYKHPDTPDLVTISNHPGDLKKWAENAVLKACGKK
jgi:predicted RNA binding protein YcfA (HicA-like mRNA interferase family)